MMLMVMMMMVRIFPICSLPIFTLYYGTIQNIWSILKTTQRRQWETTLATEYYAADHSIGELTVLYQTL